MALAPGTIFEVRTGGNDANGGGFCPGSGGTDFSQQNAAQFAFTDLATLSGTSANPIITSVSHNFVAADVGNCIAVNSGTSWFVQSGVYQIISASGNAAALDRACGTAGTLTNGTWKLGGAMASPGNASASMAGGNQMYLASGQYIVTTATFNTINGCVSLPAGATANETQMIGYGSARGDNAIKPIVAASGINTFVLVNASGAATQVQNVQVNGNLLASGTGFKFNSNGRLLSCKAQQCSVSYNLTASAEALAIVCEAVNGSGLAAINGGSTIGCVVHNNFGPGVILNNTGAKSILTISAFNSGSTADGFQISNVAAGVIGGISVGNGRHGFNITQTNAIQTLLNCAATDHMSGYGYTAAAVGDNIVLLNCGGWNNSGQGDINTTNIPSGNFLNFQSLTASPWVNFLSGDLSLNVLAGGGSLLRNNGIPTSSGAFALPFVLTPTYVDIGAEQHLAAPTGSIVSIGPGSKMGGLIR